MQVFSIHADQIAETAVLPTALPDQGFVWLAFSRREFEIMQGQVQQMLQRLCDVQIYDLHLQDVLNNQLPSHYDYTSQYDILVFRRLAAGHGETPQDITPAPTQRPKKGGPPVLRRIDTSPVGFALFDRVLLTVHPAGYIIG